MGFNRAVGVTPLPYRDSLVPLSTRGEPLRATVRFPPLGVPRSCFHLAKHEAKKHLVAILKITPKRFVQ